jgi:hypothetical protein
MSWLSEQVNPGDSTATGADPRTFSPAYFAFVKQYNPKGYESIKEWDPVFINEQQAAQEAAASTTTAGQTAAAVASNPLPVVKPDSEIRAEALGRLNSSFGGDPNSLIPGSFDDAPISNYFTAQRGKAQDYIGNLLKRGTITQSGQQAGLQALTNQDPKVRTRLNDVGNALLEQERGKVRGIYGEGATAAGSLSGEGASFDPNTYLSRAQSDISDFGSRLPDAIAAGAGDNLFDTAGLSASTGAVSGSQNLDYDPYAVPGGKLQNAPVSADATKRRTTAVF